jgi:hypothetical protein
MTALRKALVLLLLLGLAGCVSLQQVVDWSHHQTVRTQDDGSSGGGGSGNNSENGNGQGTPPG